jgi:hypothetical protein
MVQEQHIENMIEHILAGPRTDYESKNGSMAIRRSKYSDGYQWYGFMTLIGHNDLFMFDDGRVYRPTAKQFVEGLALVNKWNAALAVKRKCNKD